MLHLLHLSAGACALCDQVAGSPRKGGQLKPRSGGARRLITACHCCTTTATLHRDAGRNQVDASKACVTAEEQEAEGQAKDLMACRDMNDQGASADVASAPEPGIVLRYRDLFSFTHADIPVWRLPPVRACRHGRHVRAPVWHFARWLVRHTRRLPRQRPPSSCMHGTSQAEWPGEAYV